MHTFVPLVSARTGDGARALRSLYPLISEDAPTVEIHVAMEGAWEGHGSGAFELTRADFERICERFEANPNPIVLDYEHATVYAAEAPAAGWIHRVYVRDDADGGAHLWVTAELTEKAAKYIKAGEYRFSSGVFEFGATDHVTGEDVGVELTSVALTNLPFLVGATPITLSRRAVSASPQTKSRRPLMKIPKEALQKALDLIESDEVSTEELEAAAHMAAAQAGELSEEAEEAPAMDQPEDEAPMADEEPPAADEPEEAAAMDGEPEEAPLADEEEEAIPAGDVPDADDAAAMDEAADDSAAAALAPLLEATGLDIAGLAAAIMENLDAVAGAISGALDAPAAAAPLSDREAELALSARDQTIAALSTKLAEATAYREQREREDAERDVETLIEGGMILGDAREDWVQVRLSSRERFDKLTAGLSPVVPLGEHAAGITPAAKDADPEIEIDESDPEVKALRKQLGPQGARLNKSRIDDIIRRRVAARK